MGRRLAFARRFGTVLPAVLILAACAPAATSPPGPFTLSVVNASRNAATVAWTGARQGGGTVDACAVETFTFDDGLWIVAVNGASDAARFPMTVDTAGGGPRTLTVALDTVGRIDANARVPLDEPPCPID